MWLLSILGDNDWIMDLSPWLTAVARSAAIDVQYARALRRELLRRNVRSGCALLFADQHVTDADEERGPDPMLGASLACVAASELLLLLGGVRESAWHNFDAFGVSRTARDIFNRSVPRSSSGALERGAPFNASAVEYVCDCMWNERSALSRLPGKLKIVRVDAEQPFSVFNTLPLLVDEVPPKGTPVRSLFDDEQWQLVETVWQNERRLQKTFEEEKLE